MRTNFVVSLLLFVVASVSCSTVTPVIKNVNDPTTTAGAIVADCVKPELADQIANVLANINQIIVDPSKTEAVKESQIAALKAGGQEILACALRDGIADITAMIRNAASKNASLDLRVVTGRDSMAHVVRSEGFAYADGWTP